MEPGPPFRRPRVPRRINLVPVAGIRRVLRSRRGLVQPATARAIGLNLQPCARNALLCRRTAHELPQACAGQPHLIVSRDAARCWPLFELGRGHVSFGHRGRVIATARHGHDGWREASLIRGRLKHRAERLPSPLRPNVSLTVARDRQQLTFAIQPSSWGGVLVRAVPSYVRRQLCQRFCYGMHSLGVAG